MSVFIPYDRYKKGNAASMDKYIKRQSYWCRISDNKLNNSNKEIDAKN